MANRRPKDYIDALVDKDGLRTEVTVRLTTNTLIKLVTALLAAGVGITLIAHLLKNAFPNRQRAENLRLLHEIKKAIHS